MNTSLAIIEGAYLRDILEQPAATRRTLDSLAAAAPTAAALSLLRESRSFDRIVLTGMGSSFHALHPLNLRLNQAGIVAQMIETSELLNYYPETLGNRTLTVAVSQSGESAEIVRMLRDQVARGTVVGITNTPESSLAVGSTFSVVTAAGPESTVSCKTYLASLQALHWLGYALLGEDMATALADLAKVHQGVTSYLSSWQGHVEWFIEQLAETRQLFVTGRGWSLATAGTGGLILKESVRFSAEGMSSAAFRHGPFESLSRAVLLCICLGDDRTAMLNRRLHSDVRAAGGRSFLIAGDSPHPALRLPPVLPELLPVLEILPVQMISLALGAHLGEEAGKFALATKVTTVE
ncbi:MAG: SIS domain-containing protein [Bryobacteraceae bacterium]|nr:SIS domain-containing protein [Bryobacteraceae bacterium]